MIRAGAAPIFALMTITLIFVVHKARSQSKERAQMAAWAFPRGWLFNHAGNVMLVEKFRPPFGSGHNYEIRNYMAGNYEDFSAMVFEFHWRTGSGRSQTHHVANAVQIELPTYLPYLDLRRETIHSRLSTAFGYDDISTESADFNKKWLVRGRNTKFASDILHPRMVERLLHPDATTTGVCFDHTGLWSWETGSIKTERLSMRLKLLKDVYDLIPRYVWLDHGHDPRWENSFKAR